MQFSYKMKQKMISSFYPLKGISFFVFVPCLVNYILIPISNYAVYYSFNDRDMLYSCILFTTQCLCPFFSAWNLFFVLHYFVEEPGSEVLYIEGKGKQETVIMSYLLYIGMLLLLFIVYTMIDKKFWWLYLKICIICFFYMAFVYFLTYLSGKIITAVAGVFLYTISIFGPSTVITHYNQKLLTGWEMWKAEWGFLFAGVILFVLGIICNYKRYRPK